MRSEQPLIEQPPGEQPSGEQPSGEPERADHRVTRAPLGAGLFSELRGWILRLKAGDPMAPVTVLVPSGYTGLSLKRSLAAPGFVNVRFVRLSMLIEEFSSTELAGRGLRPLTLSVATEVVRGLLAEEAHGEVFGRHGATTEMLAQSFRRHRQRFGPEPNDTLDVNYHALFGEFCSRTGGYYDADMAARVATEMVLDGRVNQRISETGALVAYLPFDWTASYKGFVRAYGQRATVHLLCGVTGSAKADAAFDDVIGPHGRCAAGQASRPAQIPRRLQADVLLAPDAETEIRAVISRVLAQAEAGVTFGRMAVVFRNRATYARLCHERFSAAGVPVAGRGVVSLAESCAGRMLIHLLNLHRSRFSRDAVRDLFAAGPVLAGTKEVAPGPDWSLMARDAGVTSGAGQWDIRLRQFLRQLEYRGDREVRRESVTRFRQFMIELIEAASPPPLHTWAQWSEWAKALFVRYVGEPSHWSGWPDVDQAAGEEVPRRLDRLAELDLVPSARVDASAFVRAVTRDLVPPLAAVGPFGSGVFLGSTDEMVGADFDFVAVVGMVEGAFPPRPRRSASLLEESIEELTFRAAAMASHVLLSCPLGDRRSGRPRRPARWLMDAVSQRAGSAVTVVDVLDSDAPEIPGVVRIDSFAAHLLSTHSLSHRQERNLAALVAGHNGAAQPLRQRYEKQFAVIRARSGNEFTEFDGLVGSMPELLLDDEAPYSATSFERLATCPFSHFLTSVLGLGEPREPEDWRTLHPFDRGTLVHEILERFVAEARPRRTPEEAWSAEERARLVRLVDELCDRAESRGLTGEGFLWKLERRSLLFHVLGLLDVDEQHRAASGVLPVATEVAFGFPDDELGPVRVPLSDGRSVLFRGRIDRVDAAPDGSRVSVIDYKTGVSSRYRAMTKKDPLAAGKRLQLPIYARAIRQRYGNVPVEAAYWFVTEAGYKRKSAVFDDERIAEFDRTVEALVRTVEAGAFVAQPGDEEPGGFAHCRNCSFDRLCPADRGGALSRKSKSGVLVPFNSISQRGGQGMEAACG